MNPNFINKQDIIDFFDFEAEAEKERHIALMKLPVEDRVRKRKAIQNLSIDFKYAKTSEDGYTYFKLNVTKNLSDFKEGDSLILHKGEYKAGQECTLSEFDEDDNIIISVYTPSSIINKEMWSGKDLILDKNSVDLRQNVYSNFYYPLNSELEYWGEQLINNVKDVELVNKDECNEDLKETEEFFSLSFTEKQREAILNSMAAKDYYLIQGPPGTGKSFVLATIILEEIGYFNNRVAIIGPNHLAINNALMQLIKIEPSYSNSCVKVGQPYNGKGLEIERDNKTYKIHNLNRIPTDVFNKYEDGIACGLTPHSLYTKRARGLEYDTLIIDEAGQVTIPLALMAMQNGKKVILAGDHKQLSPIIVSDKIPDKLKKSIFQRLMNDNNHTLLNITFRMQEPICNFVSDLFYEGRLLPQNKGISDFFIHKEKFYSFDTPIVLQNIDDEGLQFSDKEAERIEEIAYKYEQYGISSQHIGILAPFKAQVANIKRKIKASGRISAENKNNITIDTVDKMQGQEREIIIFSMTGGDSDYILEMADFLYNANKLNVAFSRAKFKLIILGNFNKIKQLQLSDYPHLQKMLSLSYVEYFE